MGLVVGEVSARAAAEHVVQDLAVALDLELADRMSAVAADGHLLIFATELNYARASRPVTSRRVSKLAASEGAARL